MPLTEKLPGLTAGDVRAEVARSNLKLYVVAARAQIHPSLFSAILNERAPLSQALAARIIQAVKQE